MFRKIDVTLDTFAKLWSVRRPDENSEEEIIARLAREVRGDKQVIAPKSADTSKRESRPKSSDWVSVLIWALRELGGEATLAEIYAKTREARRLLGLRITPNHEASVRERMEAHSSDSRSFKHGRDLFCMPRGKGAGYWALRDLN